MSDKFVRSSIFIEEHTGSATLITPEGKDNYKDEHKKCERNKKKKNGKHLRTPFT